VLAPATGWPAGTTLDDPEPRQAVQTEGGGHPEPDTAVEALLATVREIMTDAGRVRGVRDVGIDSRLDADLGLDSLSVAELLVRTEQLFGVSLPDDTLAAARTPGDLLAAAGMAVDPPSPDVDGGQPSAGPGVRDAAPAVVTVASPHTLYGVWALAAFGIVAAVVGPLIVLAPTMRWRWRLVQGAGNLLAALVGVRVRVEGAHHLPRDRPFVMVANHASHLDPLVLVRLFDEPAVFAALAGLADHPLLRLVLRRMETHLVGRGDRMRGITDAAALADTVRAGRTVVFFPEGRRTPALGLEPFRMGAFQVAARSGVPVVPVAIRGTRAVLPVGRLLPRRATVTMTVGPPIRTRHAGWQGAVELQRDARRHILRHVHEPDLA
jgi:acyl carrier protein